MPHFALMTQKEKKGLMVTDLLWPLGVSQPELESAPQEQMGL